MIRFGTALLMAMIVSHVAWAQKQPQPQTSPIVATQQGAVQGTRTGNVETFLGLPFAAPPVGPLRWRPPAPAATWTGTRLADAFGPSCLQTRVDFTPPRHGTSEDCLTLNVWRPAHRTGAKLPVMVWIYGGGFTHGATDSALYDGMKFTRQGVIFVSLNYRVGRFGFFAHPALTHESPDGPLGNYGFMDQIAALTWIQKNIAAFGGDANNVTIFGESAGARSVDAMLIAPAARGLFQKAIIESTTHGQREALPLRDTDGGKTLSGEQLGLAFGEAAHVASDDVDALRALPAEMIIGGLAGNGVAQQRDTFYGPMVDGKILPDTFQHSFDKGAFTDVPLIIGTNDYEARAFDHALDYDALVSRFGANKDAFMKTYEPLYPNAQERRFRVMTEIDYIELSRAIARDVAGHGNPAYFYRFSYLIDALHGEVEGALHASELAFVFDNLARAQDASMGTEWTQRLFKTPLTFSKRDQDMASAMHAYWISFARTGNPNTGHLPHWNAVTADPDAVMQFTQNGPRGGEDPAKSRLDVIEAARKATGK